MIYNTKAFYRSAQRNADAYLCVSYHRMADFYSCRMCTIYIPFLGYFQKLIQTITQQLT